MEQYPSWEVNIYSARQEIAFHLQNRNFIPCSREPAIGPRPHSLEFGPRSRPIRNIHFDIALGSTLGFPTGFPASILYTFLFLGMHHHGTARPICWMRHCLLVQRTAVVDLLQAWVSAKFTANTNCKMLRTLALEVSSKLTIIKAFHYWHIFAFYRTNVYIRRPEVYSLPWTSSLAPFSSHLWFCVLAALALLTLALSTICNIQRRHGNRNEMPFGLRDSWLCMLGIFCQQGT
jgi:hypothetical protein